ncbi:hypothetical protein P7K49_023075 [Saguinus oedipus]|uniref:Uncharacterized protein n=1 Tax=Saguinus oedipus TaxID=9490 RepID=A0ABQ9UKM7_SAGOE|nr:hypothetical protein P7K49_023075 [Saguinus oedipus]
MWDPIHLIRLSVLEDPIYLIQVSVLGDPIHLIQLYFLGDFIFFLQHCVLWDLSLLYHLVATGSSATFSTVLSPSHESPLVPKESPHDLSALSYLLPLGFRSFSDHLLHLADLLSQPTLNLHLTVLSDFTPSSSPVASETSTNTSKCTT